MLQGLLYLNPKVLCNLFENAHVFLTQDLEKL